MYSLRPYIAYVLLNLVSRFHTQAKGGRGSPQAAYPTPQGMRLHTCNSKYLTVVKLHVKHSNSWHNTTLILVKMGLKCSLSGGWGHAPETPPEMAVFYRMIGSCLPKVLYDTLVRHIERIWLRWCHITAFGALPLPHQRNISTTYYFKQEFLWKNM